MSVRKTPHVSLPLDEYIVEPHFKEGFLRIFSSDPEDVIYGLGHFDNYAYFEAETYFIQHYDLESNYIDLYYA